MKRDQMPVDAQRWAVGGQRMWDERLHAFIGDLNQAICASIS
jgi:hypothetical protein